MSSTTKPRQSERFVPVIGSTSSSICLPWCTSSQSSAPSATSSVKFGGLPTPPRRLESEPPVSAFTQLAAYFSNTASEFHRHIGAVPVHKHVASGPPPHRRGQPPSPMPPPTLLWLPSSGRPTYLGPAAQHRFWCRRSVLLGHCRYSGSGSGHFECVASFAT